MSLEPDSLVSLALELLPASPSTISSSASTTDEPTSSPQQAILKTPHESLALLIHSIHTSLDFRLIDPKPSTTPEDSISTQEDASSSTPPSGSTTAHKNRLPLNWHKDHSNSIQFKYRHEQSSLEFVISIVEMGGRALIAGVAVQNPKSINYDLLLSDYFSPSAFPLQHPSTSSSYTWTFATPHRLKDLIINYRINILQPLIPGLSKPGYTELPSSSTSSSSTTNAGADRPVANPSRGYYPDPGGPLLDPSSRQQPVPRPRNERDEQDPLRIPGSGGRGAIGNPFDVGRSDLLPLGGLGGTTGLGGFPGGRGGVGIGGRGEGGGMYVGPDHPMFNDHFRGQGNVGGDRGRWGGDGFLPPGAVPPGARFDPVGPIGGGRGGIGGGRGRGRGGFGGGPDSGPGRGFGSGEPDWDDFPPPGNAGSDYDNMFG